MISLIKKKSFYGISITTNTINNTTRKCLKMLSIKVNNNNNNNNNNSNVYIRNTLNKDNSLSLLDISNNNDNNNNIITWYCCGPTVYDDAHLGHARTYICIDIIRRILTNYFNYNINYAMGLTDIDDKIIKKFNQTNNSLSCNSNDVKNISRKYENDFFNDLDKFNVRRPDAVLRVTEHIDEIIAYINGIINNGYGYVTNDGVYFDVSKCNDYGKLGNIPTNDNDNDNATTTTSSSSQHNKKNNRDFALWKYSKTNEPSWDSPWGKGRPGWHIECSAITHSYFGPNVDIHSGGIDLRFPHHTNEIAQCEAHNDSNDWVKYWIHTGHLYIDGCKMSKSLKNFISIRDYFNSSSSSSSNNNDNNASLNFRIFCLQYKYHSSLHLSDDRLQEANSYRIKIENFYKIIDSIVSSSSSSSLLLLDRSIKPTKESVALLSSLLLCKTNIRRALENDFDTPEVLRCLSVLIGEGQQYAIKYNKNDVNHPIEPLISIREYISSIVDVFGLKFNNNIIINSNSSDSNNNNNDNDVDPNTYIDNFVKFRSSIRKISLQALKNKKKKNISNDDDNYKIEENTEMHKMILGECDKVRDDVGKLGIVIEDHSDNSIWSKK